MSRGGADGREGEVEDVARVSRVFGRVCGRESGRSGRPSTLMVVM